MDRKTRLARLAPLALLTLMLCLVPTLGMAQRGGPPPGPPDPEMMLDHMTERLDLSDQQRQGLAAVFAAHRESVRAEDEKMFAARKTLGDQIHSETFDEVAIRKAAAAVASLEADRAVERGRLFQQIRGILTPEQLKEFEEMREHRRERMEQRRGDGPMGPGPGPRQHPH